MLRKAVVILLIGTVTASAVFAQNAEDIIRKLDEMQTFEMLYSEGTMISEDRFGEKVSSYRAWSRGGQDFLIEFTNLEERGQKILRVGDELYLFYPDAEDIIPMHGSALKQSLFGDVSYEDITEGRNTLDKYDVSMKGSRNVGGVDCWLIEMIAASKKVPYPKQIIMVGKSDNILRAAEYYARSGRLLKIADVKSFRKFDDGRILITEIELADQLRRGSSTLMRVDKVDINPKFEDRLFSLRSLY
ncbi:MAG: hypothetical protein B6D68_03860 [spirochete symbiont of Stewartia floridana]|nr:MAG: hypothetical protein B6D68_03860 [spirochete symbiont of Stewartia floridana]